ncbi:MAG: Maf family protein, partial [Rhodospirillales bacterium]
MGKSILNIVLASRSTVRGNLLRAAGVKFLQETSDVDETVIKSEMLKKSARPEIIARALARAKALRVA